MKKEKLVNRIAIFGIVIALIFSLILVYVPNVFNLEEATITYSYEDELFDKTQIMTVDIKIDENDWEEMLENAINEEYYKCDIVVNGVTYKNVGIRPKGNTSLSQVYSDDTTDRYSFKVEFDHYVDNQTCGGLDKLVLNNLMSDATYMKEYISYDILNYLGVPSSLYSFASISVNGETWGLYLALEGVEESFAQRNFGSAYGDLYKPEGSLGMGGNRGNEDMENRFMPNANMGQQGDTTENINSIPDGSSTPEDSMTEGENIKQNDDTTQNESSTQKNETEKTSQKGFFEGFGGGNSSSNGGADLAYVDDEISSYSTLFESSVFDTTDEDYKRVIEALKNLSTGTDLETYIDVDEVLRYIAANVFLVNDDSYFGTMLHNYYLYEKNGKLSMIPWDYNLAFGGFQGSSATSLVNRPIDTVVSGTTLDARPMIGKLLEVEEYKEQYHAYLDELIAGYFESGHFEEMITELENLISPYVENDPTAFYTYDEFKTAISNLKEFCLLRAESIRGQLEGTIPSTSEEQENQSDVLVDASNVSIQDMGTQGGGNKGGNENQGGIGAGGGWQQNQGNQGNPQGMMPGMPNAPQGTEGTGQSDGDTTQGTMPEMPNTPQGTEGTEQSDGDTTQGTMPEMPDTPQGTEGIGQSDGNTTQETMPEMPNTPQGTEQSDGSTTQGTMPEMPNAPQGNGQERPNRGQGNGQGQRPDNLQMPEGQEIGTSSKDTKIAFAIVGACTLVMCICIVVTKKYHRRKYHI